ncbi:MAG: hypothetical protein FJX67_18070, partial [Alphaproteobacteria bacterium]|nr:hypothetical protein [Alphaproteobacteria bacterium]
MTGTIFLEESELSVAEPNAFVYVPIVRTGDLSGTAVIQYGITANTATPGVDYIGTDGTVTMEIGQDRILVPIQIVNDTQAEPTETFTLSIVNVDAGSTLLFPRTARIDILDDENPVVDPPNPPLTSAYLDVLRRVAARRHRPDHIEHVGRIDVLVDDDDPAACVVARMTGRGEEAGLARMPRIQPVITGLSQPMAFEFALQDSSVLYIAEKGGRIRVFDTDTGSFLPDFVNLTAKVNNIQDRGLIDIALHPNFPATPYLYAFYVADPPDTVGRTGHSGPDGAGNRFAQNDAEAARTQWRQVADQLRPRVPKLAAMMDEAEADVLAYMS